MSQNTQRHRTEDFLYISDSCAVPSCGVSNRLDVTIAGDDLANAIMDEKHSTPKGDEETIIDNTIFYYVDEKELLSLPDEELAKILDEEYNLA